MDNNAEVARLRHALEWVVRQAEGSPQLQYDRAAHILGRAFEAAEVEVEAMRRGWTMTELQARILRHTDYVHSTVQDLAGAVKGITERLAADNYSGAHELLTEALGAARGLEFDAHSVYEDLVVLREVLSNQR